MLADLGNVLTWCFISGLHHYMNIARRSRTIATYSEVDGKSSFKDLFEFVIIPKPLKLVFVTIHF